MPEAHTSNPQEDQASIRWQEATKFTPEYAQLLAAAFEHASGGVVIFRGSDLTYLMANEKYLALMPGKDIVGKPAHEVLEPWPELEPIFLRVLETGEPYHARDLRYSLRSYPSGPLEERFFSWSVTRVRLPDQEGWFLLNTCVETTDRVHAEQALKEREALLSAFFESPGAFRGIVEIAGDHLIFISCNRAMAEWCGSNAESISGKLMSPVEAPREVEQQLRQLFEESKRRRQPASMEISRSETSGQREFYCSASYLGEGPSGSSQFAFNAVDITPQKRAQEALYAMQAKLAAALESSADSVYISDAEGRLVDFNEAFVKCHRFQNKAECFKTLVEYPTILDAFLPDGSLMPLDNWAVSRALRGESGTNEVYHLRRKDTGEEWIGSYSFAPIRDSGGAIIGSVVVGRDITEQRRAEVAEREREAQKLTSLQLMAGGVAHDFNNLLAAVLGNASLAEARLPADSFEATLVRRAIRAGEQAAELSLKMLAYAGKAPLVIEPLALASVVPEILDALRSRIPPQIRVSLQLQADAPAVSADRGGLQQILQNLVINAVEAIGQKTGEITIRTERQVVDAAFARECPEAASLKPGAYVRIEVQDTGEGMDATTKAKVFDPFFSTKFTGRGLGLPVVSGVVRGHGGAVWLSSTPGHGSTLVVLLPAAAAVATVTETATPLEYLRGSAGVLVVDDDPLVREVIKDSLELLGYQVLTADSGAQAVATVRDRHADIALVILDWTMPAMDGYQTLEAIRKISADVKILISSGYGEQSALTRFKGQNVVGFLPKPFKVTSIAAKVRDALR